MTSTKPSICTIVNAVEASVVVDGDKKYIDTKKFAETMRANWIAYNKGLEDDINNYSNKLDLMDGDQTPGKVVLASGQSAERVAKSFYKNYIDNTFDLTAKTDCNNGYSVSIEEFGKKLFENLLGGPPGIGKTKNSVAEALDDIEDLQMEYESNLNLLEMRLCIMLAQAIKEIGDDKDGKLGRKDIDKLLSKIDRLAAKKDEVIKVFDFYKDDTGWVDTATFIAGLTVFLTRGLMLPALKPPPSNKQTT